MSQPDAIVSIAPDLTAALYVCQRSMYDRAVDPPVTRPGGLFRSTDGGVTWTQLVDYHFAHRLTVSPLDPRVLYLGTTDHPYHDDSIAAGLLKSEDGGEGWVDRECGSHLSSGELHRREARN